MKIALIVVAIIAIILVGAYVFTGGSNGGGGAGGGGGGGGGVPTPTIFDYGDCTLLGGHVIRKINLDECRDKGGTLWVPDDPQFETVNPNPPS